MPDKAYVRGKAMCPSCGAQVLEEVRCQWGMVPSRYAIGDPVRWLTDARGELVKPFTLKHVDPQRYRWNCGDPAFENVIVFDVDISTGDHGVECGTCRMPVAASAAVVRDGRFQELRVLGER